MRTLSSDALRAIYAEETGDFPIMLITISDSGLTNPIRVSSDPTQRLEENETDIIYGTVSNGENYYFIPFQLVLPSDTEAAAPQVSLTIDNISKELVPVIRNLTSRPAVTIDIVMSCSLNTIEATFPDFSISSVTYDAMSISGELSIDIMNTEPFPSGTFTPSQFPGIF